MKMVRWASGTSEHFQVHVWGTIHAIKEMELDTKFREAAKAVESSILEVELTKMQYKDELKKREKDDSSPAGIRSQQGRFREGQEVQKGRG